MTNIAIFGGGKMAEAVFSQADGFPEYRVSAIISRTPVAWAKAVPQYVSLDDLEARPDVLIDFTLPRGILAAAQWCGQSGTALLSGTTGLAENHREALKQASRSAAVLSAPNLSTGVAIVRLLAEETSKICGGYAEVQIEETHHAHKKDAPSGTALMLGEAIAAMRNRGDIEYSSVREGDEIGRHVLRFNLPGEEIEIIHQAKDRSIYAIGALRAAGWLSSQQPGFYDMADFLEVQ